MKVNIEIIFKPNKTHLEQIENWLVQEEKETGEGFYCNWNNINDAFHKNTLAILELNKIAIGFVIWRSYNFTATIDIIEINPIYRGQFFGHLLINQVFNFLKAKNIKVVDLQCAPSTSESFWKLLKFCEFPDLEKWNYGNKKLYRILVPFCKLQKINEKTEQLQLWNDEPYATNNKKPTWTWKIKYKSGTNQLIEPIIFPSDYDWRLCWRKGEEVFIDDKVKYFKKESIIENKFIYINELKK